LDLLINAPLVVQVSKQKSIHEIPDKSCQLHHHILYLGEAIIGKGTVALKKQQVARLQ
jgi:hypothetical protein